MSCCQATVLKSTFNMSVSCSSAIVPCAPVYLLHQSYIPTHLTLMLLKHWTKRQALFGLLHQWHMGLVLYVSSSKGPSSKAKVSCKQ